MTPDARPTTVKGEDDPVAVLVVCPAAVAVAVNDVAAGDPAGRENDTVAAPSLNALFVPTSVAVTLTGVCGDKKSFCARDFLPALLFAAIISSPYTFSNYYADKSPYTTQVLAALLNIVADDH